MSYENTLARWPRRDDPVREFSKEMRTLIEAKSQLQRLLRLLGDQPYREVATKIESTEASIAALRELERALFIAGDAGLTIRMHLPMEQVEPQQDVVV